MISKIAKIFIIAFVIIVLIAVALIFVFIPLKSDKKIDTDGNNKNINPVTTITKENFDFNYQYKGNNTFEYEIRGNLPTPCYKTKVDALVRESYPEQIVVQLSISEPDPDTACIQVIQEYEYKDTVNVSEQATFEFNVIYGQ